MQAIQILACGDHLPCITTLLDEAGVPNWTAIPAAQARRSGYLQNVRGRHPDQCFTVFGFAGGKVMARFLAALEKARDEGDLCAECLAYAWEVRAALPAHVALDPVSDEVVDSTSALSAEYNGKTFYFDSAESQDAFLRQPGAYVRRLQEQLVGRRDLVS